MRSSIIHENRHSKMMRPQSKINALERKNVMSNKQPCIAIDVSKGKSHVCGFVSKKKAIGKVTSIRHDLDGFLEIDKLYELLLDSTDSDPCLIFESTGIYHRPLRRYLEVKGYNYIEVSPLLSAKYRKNSAIRSAKTDARDTHSLANLFYDHNLVSSEVVKDIYYELQQYHRHHYSLTVHLIKCKVHFNEKLDILFPNFRVDISNKIYEPYFLELLKALPHPNSLVSKRVDAIENILLSNGMQVGRVQTMARYIKEYCAKCCPGSDEYSGDTFILIEQINMIQDLIRRRDEVIKKMIILGESLPLYNQLLSIPGIGPNTAICLISELGDLNRFESSRQLVAYAGLDPIVYQSGNQDGKGLSISKKGNKHLRQKLYQVIKVSANSRQDHRIKEFVQKKRQTLSPKSAYIAGCDKLLKIIYRMNQTGDQYKM